MADFRVDQAAGLRRLFAQRQLRVVTFASGAPGVGKTTLAANVAVALARQGEEVLIVDENSGARHMGGFFGVTPAGDLLQVVNRQLALEEVLFSPAPGVRVLPAGRAARQLTRLLPAQRRAMLEGINRLAEPIDVILVDSAPDHARGFSPWGLAAGEAVMVVSGSGASITEAYALIKKVSLVLDRRHFRILANRVKSAQDGLIIFNNLKKVAGERGVACLEYGGAVPADASLKRLGQFCQPIVEVLPESSSAQAIRAFAAHMLTWPEAEYEHGGVEHFVERMLHSGHAADQRMARLSLQ
ncbi:MAG: AAA family ATPase [Zoogloeaceae bacterium]|jgi:flagellar biosynthesis protein FlhG|nr:AAA family ATPase [Zoogloeaceae bacterium]